MNRLFQEKAAVKANSRVFGSLVEKVERLVSAGKFERASTVAEIAAHFASTNHPGIFSSSRLEESLRRIGRETVEAKERLKFTSRLPHKIVHVLTQALAIGGATRSVWRWILMDDQRSHSVVVTDQRDHPVPHALRDAVESVKGDLTVLDQHPPGSVARAQKLCDLSREADLVVLHTHSRDIVPMLAFSDEVTAPAVARLDLADHLFWLDLSIANSVFFMREAAVSMARARRGVQASSWALVPIPLEPLERTLSREEAKRKIGIDESALVLLTIATGYKYVSPNKPGFVGALEPLLQRYPQAVLIAVGPENMSEWREASNRTDGRVLALGPRQDTAQFYQAADIYLDSFPFSSNTSMLEAGSYGLPMVSYSPYEQHARVLGPGCPGLASVLIEAKTISSYGEELIDLIEDPNRRARLGHATKSRITRLHSGAQWVETLQEAYSTALGAQREAFRSVAHSGSELEDLDLAVNWILQQADAVNLETITDQVVRPLGLFERFGVIMDVWKATGVLRKGAILPAWLDRELSRVWQAIRGLLPAT